MCLLISKIYYFPNPFCAVLEKFSGVFSRCWHFFQGAGEVFLNYRGCWTRPDFWGSFSRMSARWWREGITERGSNMGVTDDLLDGGIPPMDDLHLQVTLNCNRTTNESLIDCLHGQHPSIVYFFVIRASLTSFLIVAIFTTNFFLLYVLWKVWYFILSKGYFVDQLSVLRTFDPVGNFLQNFFLREYMLAE